MPRRDIVKRIAIARQQILEAQPFLRVGKEHKTYDPDTVSVKRYVSRTAEEIEKETEDVVTTSLQNELNQCYQATLTNRRVVPFLDNKRRG